MERVREVPSRRLDPEGRRIFGARRARFKMDAFWPAPRGRLARVQPVLDSIPEEHPPVLAWFTIVNRLLEWHANWWVGTPMAERIELLSIFEEC